MSGTLAPSPVPTPVEPGRPVIGGPKDAVGLDYEVARRTVRAGVFLVAAAAAVFGAVYLVAGSMLLGVPTLATCLVLVVIGFVPFRDPSRQLTVGIAVGLMLLTSQVLLVGDVAIGTTVWFLVPSAGALLLGRRRTGFAGAVVGIGAVMLVIAARRFGWPIIGHEPMPEPDLAMGLSVVGSLVVLSTFAWINHVARRRLLAEVEERNTDLGTALTEAEAARGAAIEAAQAKDRFFANLTHEIRTPLNGIAGTTELLRHTRLDETQRELTDALVASSDNLVALVNAMLDHARLRAGHVGVEAGPVEVRRLARELYDLFAAQAADRGLGFEVAVADDVPAWLETDAIRLRQIVANLVGNAIKFTAHGRVSVRGSIAAADAAHPLPRLVVQVADTGVGIAPDQVRAIFEPFIQGDASISRTYGGTGLGLAIALQLAELLGGTLSVRSVIGEGSVFSLAIPARPVARAAAPTEAATSAAAPPVDDPPDRRRGGTRVLLAEDNEINQAVASRMLARLDAAVVVAENGYRAVELAAGGGFELVLMDLQMPGLDGIAAAREIRRAERTGGRPGVPIVAMTGNDPADYGDACADAGMNGFLMKPVRLDDLREVLSRTTASAGREA